MIGTNPYHYIMTDKTAPEAEDASALAPNDHRRLGQELGLFTFSDLVGSGLPLWLPKGATVRRILERYIVEVCYVA